MATSRNQALPTPNWMREAIEKTRRGELFMVPYAQLVAEATQYVDKLAQEGIIIGAPGDDTTRFGFAVIDPQITFCYRGGELSVPGAEEDSIRTAEFIVKYVNRITTLAVTMDTHSAFQIFHPVFWVNAAGEHPRIFTNITTADIRSGAWTVNPQVITAIGVDPADIVRWVIYYCDQLERKGKYQLTIWPFHAMLGGIGHAVMPVIEAALFWWELLRGAKVHKEIKGTNAITEMYSAIIAEVNADANGVVIAPMQIGFLSILANNDIVAIAGQAKSHCVLFTAKDLFDLVSDPDNNSQHLLGRMRFMWDLSSSVQGFEAKEDEFAQELTDKGYRIVKSTDPIEAILS